MVRKTLCLAVILCLGFQTFGQTSRVKKAPRKKNNPEQAAANPEQHINERARYELQQLLEASKRFEDKGLAVQIQAQIADLLWKYDESLARSLFQEALQKFGTEAVQTARSSGASAQSGTLPVTDPSVEVLSLLSKNDPELAKKLLEQKTIPQNASSDNAAERILNRSQQATKYAQMALQAVQTNPQLAFKLAENSLEYGLSAHLIPVLFSLRQTDAAKADSLFVVALALAEQDSLNRMENLARLIPYVMSGSGFANSGTGANTVMTASLVGRFLNFAYQSLLNTDALAQRAYHDEVELYNAYYYRTIQQLMALFEARQPERAEQLRAKLTQLLNGMLPETRTKVAGDNSRPDVSTILRKAEAAMDRKIKDGLYYQAALTAQNEGNVEEALSIIKKIENSNLRSSAESKIRARAAATAINKKEFDLAASYIQEIPDLLERASGFSQLAKAFEENTQVSRATEIINEASRSIATGPSGPNKANAMLLIAQSAGRLSVDRGFEQMEAAIKCINEIDASTEKESKNRGTLGPGKSLTARSSVTPGKLDFDGSFSLLARSDLDRALALARSIRETPVSVIAQVIIWRAWLTKPQGLDPASSSSRQ